METIGTKTQDFIIIWKMDVDKEFNNVVDKFKKKIGEKINE